MKVVSFDDLEPEPHDDYHTDRRDLSEPLGVNGVAIARYVLEPGERFSGSVHAHADQEEIFLVLAGEATFETRPDDADGGETGAEHPDEARTDAETDGEGSSSEYREIPVGPNEAIRFAPGEFQSGWNDGDEPVVAFALGVPPDSDDVRISRIPVLGDRDVSCPECGHGSMRLPTADDSGLVCPACGETASLE